MPSTWRLVAERCARGVGPVGVDLKARAAIAGRQTARPLSITLAQGIWGGGGRADAPTSWLRGGPTL